MSAVLSMFQATEYIETHLREPITIADVANSVSYSLYHFCRTFNKTVHHTPYDYLMRRRLSESALELVETDRKIIDIAFDYQFNNAETFSRAFKRMFGLQPNQWRKQGQSDRRLLMPRLTVEYLSHISQDDFSKPVLEERGYFPVAGVMAILTDDPEQIEHLWRTFEREASHVGSVAEPEEYYGIVYYPDGWERRGFLYMAGVRIDRIVPASDATVVKVLPAMRYARFVHKGPRNSLCFTRDYIYQTWLPKSSEQLACPMEVECYNHNPGHRCNETSGFAILIPLK